MKRLCIALIAASLLIAGCGKPEDKFVGTYAGSLELPPEAIEQIKALSEQFGQDPEKAIAELEGLSMTLVLKEEGVFTLTSNTSDKSDTTNGTWTLAEDESSVSLTLDEAPDGASNIGMTDDDLTQVFKVSEDGKSLSYTETQGGMSGKVTFTRS